GTQTFGQLLRDQPRGHVGGAARHQPDDDADGFCREVLRVRGLRRRERRDDQTTNEWCHALLRTLLSLRGLRPPRNDARYHSALMPFWSMNLVQFRISFSSFAFKIGPGAYAGSMSSLARRARTFSLAITDSTALAIFAFTASGMPFGPNSAYQKPR